MPLACPFGGGAPGGRALLGCAVVGARLAGGGAPGAVGGLMFPKSEAQERLLASVRPLLPRFAERAAGHDRAGSFPFENFEELASVGYLAAPIPVELGGGGHGLTDVVLSQLEIARADGSTALAVGMHLMTCGTEASARSWPAELRERVFGAVVSEGVLLNAVAAEPEMGSPRGGGRPMTTLVADGAASGGGWLLRGRKTYTTLAPALRYFLVFATFDDAGDASDVARVAVPRDRPGIRVEETWDALGMRATGSHDVFFDDVPVSESDLLVRRPLGRREGGSESPWFPSLVAAASLGVAEAAREYTVGFARGRRPTGYASPISQIPHVREQVARMDALLFAARALLLETVEDWDVHPEAQPDLGARVAASKRLATNSAVEVLELAMRVVGGQALQRSEPLERYFRDVRAGLVNPPIEARALETIARAALDGPEGAPGAPSGGGG